MGQNIAGQSSCRILENIKYSLKKQKMDSNPRFGPGHIIKADKKDIANYRLNLPLNLNYKFTLLVLKNEMLKKH